MSKQNPFQKALGSADQTRAQAAPSASTPADARRHYHAEIPLDALTPNPYQPRYEFPETEIAALADSIQSGGLLEDILVTPIEGNRYHVVAGERRWRAYQVLRHRHPTDQRWHTISAKVRRITDERELRMLALIENLHRSALTPVEQALSFAALHKDGMTDSAIAEQVALGRTTITETRAIAALPSEFLEKARKLPAEKQSKHTLLAITREADPKAQKHLMARYLTGKLRLDEARPPRPESEQKPAKHYRHVWRVPVAGRRGDFAITIQAPHATVTPDDLRRAVLALLSQLKKDS